MRDTFDRFTPHQRGLFGDNEQKLPKVNQVERVRLIDLTLVLRKELAISIAVTQTEGANEPFISCLSG